MELTRGLIVLETLESPVTAERRERRYFDYGQVQRRRHGLCLRFVDAVDASDASDCPDTTPTRRALASKPAGSTEWQLGTLNGLSWSGLTHGLTVRRALSCVRLEIIVVASAITSKTLGAALYSQCPDTPDASMYADF